MLTADSLCARTPTWTDSSSSARRESWTSRYLLPPTSSTAWRSEKDALHPLTFHLLWLRQNKRDLWLLNTAAFSSVWFHIHFHPSPPLPPPTLLSHSSPGSSQHGENPGDHPIPASALQPAVQGSDSEWQRRGHYCHHQVGPGTATVHNSWVHIRVGDLWIIFCLETQFSCWFVTFYFGGGNVSTFDRCFLSLFGYKVFNKWNCLSSCLQSSGPHCCKVPRRKPWSLPALLY